jgi:hypothetical protein
MNLTSGKRPGDIVRCNCLTVAKQASPKIDEAGGSWPTDLSRLFVALWKNPSS